MASRALSVQPTTVIAEPCRRAGLAEAAGPPDAVGESERDGLIAAPGTLLDQHVKVDH